VFYSPNLRSKVPKQWLTLHVAYFAVPSPQFTLI
jgi:hypothetical protein